MKKLIFLFAIVLTMLNAQAQTHTLNIGTNGFVVVDGQNYKRGDLQSVYNYRTADSGYSFVFSCSRLPLFSYTIDSNFIYGDSTNKHAYSFTVLRAWIDSFFEFRGVR